MISSGGFLSCFLQNSNEVKNSMYIISSNPMSEHPSLAISSNNTKYNEKLLEKIVNLKLSYKIKNEKLEQSVVNLLTKDKKLDNLGIKQINDFSFVNDKVRLEIILSNETELGSLRNFNKNIVIESSYENLVQALVPISLVENLSKEDYIKYIQKPTIAQPCVTSEGVGVIGADNLQNIGYYGDNVKVAIIDAGFTGYTSNPDIPSVRIKEVKSFRSDGYVEVDEHGSACAEIILDVAPHANLYLYVISTDVEFCNALSYAVSKGVKIVSVSLGFFNENDLDGTGTICNAVNSARASGVLVCVAAGNSAESHYCGWYTDNDYNNLNDFDTGDNCLYLGYLPAGSLIDLYLSWNDWPHSHQDYDLWLMSYQGYYAYSTNRQTGSQTPTEEIGVNTLVDDYWFVFIAKYSATNSVRFQLFSYSCGFLDNNHPETSLWCPSDATGSMSAGATYWQNDNLESFSSQGPTNDGRTKPDVTAPDGVSTYTYGTGGFSGTSASAPHVAGAAALLLSAGPQCAPSDLQNLLETKAVDLGPSGKDNSYGSGRINVFAAYDYMKPKANFTYSPLNPTTATTIQFTDTSTDSFGNIVSWSWKFGDGSTSTLRNPTHKYNNNGVYTVTLNVTDDNGAKDTKSKSVTVTNVPPVANFVYSPTNPKTNEIIQFTDTSTDSDGTVVSWSWNFGDVTASTLQNPTHKYTDEGTYTVTLNITDDDGAKNSKSKSVNVSNVPPVSNFTYSPLNPNTSDTIQFNDTSTDSDGTVISWSWKFGDGGTSTLRNPTHKYTNNGVYTVTLNVTDDDGAKGIKSKLITVSNVPPTANFSYVPSYPKTSDTIQFNDTSTDSDGTVVSWYWKFGDGSTSTLKNPTHQYTNNGVYTATLNVTDDDGAKSAKSKSITVTNVPPVANFTYFPIIPKTIDTVQFNDHSIDSDGTIVLWLWSFGDGNTSTLRNASHHYAIKGNYSVTLNVTDDDGAINVTNKQIQIINTPPIVNFSFIPNFPTVNDIIQLNDSSFDYDGTLTSWYWNLGDGNTSTTRNTTHQYAHNITYSVTLTVTDNEGGVSSLSKQIITRVIYHNLTKAGNETTIDLQNETDTIILINTSNSTIVNVSKYSGNPTWENISNDITAFGNYIDIEVENESAIVWPVVIKMYYTQNDLNASHINETQLLGVYFWNKTLGKWQLYSDTGVNISYNQSGYDGYCWTNAWHLTPLIQGGDAQPPSKVTGLTVTDAKDGKLNLACNPATDNFAVDHYKIYRNGVFLINQTSISYQDTGLTNGQSYTYQVSAVDTVGNEGAKSNPVSGAPTASSPPGGGGTSSPPPSGGGFIPPIGPMNTPPIAEANGPYYGFIGSPTTFDGSASNDADGNITSYAWTFGDGTTGTGKVTTHAYNKVGNYTVKLTVTDDDGETNVDTTYAVITEKPNYPPNANFSYSPLNPTTDDTVQFTDLSTDTDGIIVSYYWNFSDGTNSTDKNPKHTYSKSGAYMITLKITDDDGAIDIYSKAILVEESNKGITGTATEKPKGTPGFELIFVVCAIALVLLWKRKRVE